MYNDKLVYKLVIWVFFGKCVWKEKVALKYVILFMEQANILSSVVSFTSAQFC